MSANDVLKTINDDEVKFVDFRFTDTRGKEQHVSVQPTLLMKKSFKVARCLMAHRSPAGKVSMSPT